MNSQVKQNPLHALLAEFRATEGVAAKNGRMSAIAMNARQNAATMITVPVWTCVLTLPGTGRVRSSKDLEKYVYRPESEKGVVPIEPNIIRFLSDTEREQICWLQSLEFDLDVTTDEIQDLHRELTKQLSAEYPSPRRSTIGCMGSSFVGVFRCNSEVQYSPAVDLITCYYAVHG